MSGRARYSGDLTLSQDVSLDNGILYVDGNLTIDGDLSGVGAIVCTGNLTVNGSMNVASDMAALVADGNVSINGDGPASSSFQGLVYAGGSFSASNTQIVGAFVDADDAGTTSLANVRAVHAPELTSLDVMGAAGLPSSAPEFLEGQAGLNIPMQDIEVFADGGGGYLNNPNDWPPNALVLEWNGDTYNTWEAAVAAGAPPDARNYYERVETDWANRLSDINQQGEIAEFPVFQLDLNKFLRLSDKIRVLVWRTL